MTRHILVLAAALASCGGDATSPTSTDGGLRVQNSASTNIDGVFYSQCAAPSFGPNRLVGEVIVTGASKDFTVAPGCYDVLIHLVDRREARFSAVDVPPGTIKPVRVTN